MTRTNAIRCCSLICLIALGAAGLVGSGCASHSAAARREARAAAIQTATAGAASSTATTSTIATVLSGFEFAPATSDWQIGDRVLLEVITHKQEQTATRYLLVELTGEEDPGKPMMFTASPAKRPPFHFKSQVVYTQLTLFDEAAAPITTVRGRFARDLLGCGLLDGVELAAAHPEWKDRQHDLLGDSTPEEYAHAMRGWITLFSFSGSLGKKGLFRDMLKDLVARPTWIRMLLNPSIALGFADGWPTVAEPWTPEGAAGPAVETIRVPLTCTISGRPGAMADVVVTRAVAPLSLCGGVISVNARNADDPSIRMEVRLLAARRGTGGQTFTRDMTEPDVSSE